MTQYNLSQKIFAEAAFYTTEEEKIEAKQYLELWKKNQIFKLKRDCYQVKVIDEQWGDRDPMYSGSLAQYANLYLKITVEADFYFELQNYK